MNRKTNLILEELTLYSEAGISGARVASEVFSRLISRPGPNPLRLAHSAGHRFMKVTGGYDVRTNGSEAMVSVSQYGQG